MPYGMRSRWRKSYLSYLRLSYSAGSIRKRFSCYNRKSGFTPAQLFSHTILRKHQTVRLPVLFRRDSHVFLKQSAKIIDIRVPALVGDLAAGQIRFYQQAAGPVDSGLMDSIR